MAMIISLLTIGYALLGSLTQDNFTTIGHQLGYPFLFIIWTSITATYFLKETVGVFKKFYYSFPFQKILSAYIYLAILMTPFIPYTEQNIFLDDLHVFFAMSASVIYLTAFGFFLLHLRKTQPQVTKQIEVPFWCVIYTLFFCLLFFGQINSIVEIVLVISMSYLLNFLKKI